MKENTDASTTILLTRSMKCQLQEAAQHEGITVGQFARRAIKNELEGTSPSILDRLKELEEKIADR